MKKITLLALLFSCGGSFAQIINTAPYILTVNELKAWTQDAPTASTDLICTVPLAQRFINADTQFTPALNNMQIAYLPDGMNNFGNYYGEQNQFNLYNFTHWAYIDKFVWFGGTSSQTIQIPSSPWANTAHKNGVKIFGDVFFSPTAFGGSTATLQNFLEQDGEGNFVAIPKMIAIMQYYNFDGWFINQETATTAATAQLMYAFVRDLTAQAEAVGKEVMWYDAMILNGNVGWQNRLNGSNSPFLQNDQDADLSNGYETKVSSSIFINFFWASASFPGFSRTRANLIGRSSYDVFTGVDIWPGRNQGDFAINGNTFMGNLHENTTTAFTSLGLFATNSVYSNSTYTNFNNDPADVDSFYSAENHMFAGLDRNPATVDATGFKGFGNWVPETSVIMGTFQTNFSTGHGTKKFDTGLVASSNSWHNMNEQSLLPTWEWAFSQNGILSAKWDFDEAYSGGNSIKISGNLPANTPIDLMLYKTKIPVDFNNGATHFNLLFKTSNPVDSKMKLLIVFSDEVAQRYEFPLTEGFTFNGWTNVQTSLIPYTGREIAMIGLRFDSETTVTDYSINIGGLNCDTALGTVSAEKQPNAVTVSYPGITNNNVVFTINWPSASQLKYTVYDIQGKSVSEKNIAVHKITNFSLDTSNLHSGAYFVKFTDKNNISETRKIIVK